MRLTRASPTTFDIPLIDRLPPEIWSEIFIHCISSDSETKPEYSMTASLLLCHVCSSWRQIAQREPRLWDSLDLRFDSSLGSSVSSQYLFTLPERFAEQSLFWLEHAGSKGLSLSANLFWLSSQTFKLEIRKLRSHMEKFHWKASTMWDSFVYPILVDHAHHFRRLAITFDNNRYLMPFLTIKDHNRLTLLESVYLKGSPLRFPPNIYVGALSIAPQLKRAIILPEALSRQYFLPLNFLPWNQLTHLMVSIPWSCSLWRAVLGRCGSLRECLISIQDNFHDIDPDLRTDWLSSDGLDAPLTLVHLTYLDILFHSTSLTLFFAKFAFPHLAKLAIRSIISTPDTLWHSSVSHFHLFDQLRGLQSLTLGYQGVKATMLLELLEHTGDLVELIMDNYMDSFDYSLLFNSLTCNPDNPSSIRLPKLQTFELYLEGGGRFLIGFQGADFVKMVSSRLPIDFQRSQEVGPEHSTPNLSVASLKKVRLCADALQKHNLEVVYAFEEVIKAGGGHGLNLIVDECDPFGWLPQDVPSWD